jgi:hypothetical protein
LFSIEIPYTIRTPTDPICEPVECLQYADSATKELACSAERTKIIVTLNPELTAECTKYDAKFSFRIGKGTFKADETWSGIINAPSGLTSLPLEAKWSTAGYQDVAQYVKAPMTADEEKQDLSREQYNDSVARRIALPGTEGNLKITNGKAAAIS